MRRRREEGRGEGRGEEVGEGGGGVIDLRESPSATGVGCSQVHKTSLGLAGLLAVKNL